GPEDHDLADDEQQHPQVLGVHAGAAVRRRRTVVIVIVVVVDGRVGEGGGFHLVLDQAAVSAAPRSATTCSISMFDALRTRAMRSWRSQPERSSGSVEITTEFTV